MGSEGIKRNIGWCDETWNPIRGCRNGCWATPEHPEGNCYAAEICRRQLTRCTRCHDHLDVHYHPERLGQPHRWRRPRQIFCGSMTDPWSEGVEPEWRREVWDVMRATPRHRYVVLTKCPERIDGQELAGLDNLVLGVSVCTPDDAWRADILRDLAFAGPKAVSFEPLLIHGQEWWPMIVGWASCIPGLDWIIVGAPTGAVARMYPLTAREATVELPRTVLWIIARAEALGVPVWIKGNLDVYLGRMGSLLAQIRGGRYRQWPQMTPAPAEVGAVC